MEPERMEGRERGGGKSGAKDRKDQKEKSEIERNGGEEKNGRR